jgi:hypothetical protein|tara:strand:+ start:257 stop:556 length:300 start_codon:yes stop_codon:yes gene_type:complete
MSKNRKKIKCDEKKRSDGEKYKTILRINATPNPSILNDISVDNELTKKNTLGYAIRKAEEEGFFRKFADEMAKQEEDKKVMKRKLKVKRIFDWLFGGKK